VWLCAYEPREREGTLKFKHSRDIDPEVQWRGALDPQNPSQYTLIHSRAPWNSFLARYREERGCDAWYAFMMVLVMERAPSVVRSIEGDAGGTTVSTDDRAREQLRALDPLVMVGEPELAPWSQPHDLRLLCNFVDPARTRAAGTLVTVPLSLKPTDLKGEKVERAVAKAKKWIAEMRNHMGSQCVTALADAEAAIDGDWQKILDDATFGAKELATIKAAWAEQVESQRLRIKRQEQMNTRAADKYIQPEPRFRHWKDNTGKWHAIPEDPKPRRRTASQEAEMLAEYEEQMQITHNEISYARDEIEKLTRLIGLVEDLEFRVELATN